MTYKPVPHIPLRDQELADPETKALYEAYKLQIDLAMALKKARKKRHMTQEKIADIMHTHKPVISRIESAADVKHFPSLLTVVKFANALGCELKFALVPFKQTKLSKKQKLIRKKAN